MLKHLTNKDEFNSIIESNKEVVVDFFATWCGPCRMLGPVIEELSSEISDIEFLKVDVDEFPEIAQQFGVMNIPTIIVFKDNKQVNKHVGYLAKAQLKDLL